MTCLRWFAFSIAIVLGTPALAQDDDAERLRIHGSNVLGERLVPTLVVAWLDSIEYKQIRQRALGPLRSEISAVRDGERLVVEIDKRGTASGFSDIVSGDAEIGMTARKPTVQELDDAWQLGDLHSPAQEWVVALDGLAVLVAPGNPVSSVSIAQLRDILTGRIRDWSQLGGRAGAIDLHLMPGQSGTQELTARFVLGNGKASAPARRHPTQTALIAAMRGSANALGIVGLRVSHVGLKPLGIRSGAQVFLPDMLSLRSEDYPLAQRLHFHTPQLITALGRGFVQYAISPAGQAVVDRSQFVSFLLAPMQRAGSADAPAEYQQIVGNARRLPMALRFSTGLDLFDSRSRQDLERLSAYLARPENAERKLVLVGFANPEPKNPYQALALSQERVDYVASELLALQMKVVKVRGLGGRMSLVDAGQSSSRFRNDRVEVWIR